MKFGLKACSKWRCTLSEAVAVVCIAVGFAVLGSVLFVRLTGSGAATATAADEVVTVSEKIERFASTASTAATTEGTVDASAVATDKNAAESAQGSEDATNDADTEDEDAEDEEETYVYYESVPYYRGYYYIDGAWVWRGRGKAPFPPPRIRPKTWKSSASARAAKSKKSSALAKTTAKKHNSAAEKATSFKSITEKSVRVKRSSSKSRRHGSRRSSAPRGPRR